MRSVLISLSCIALSAAATASAQSADPDAAAQRTAPATAPAAAAATSTPAAVATPTAPTTPAATPSAASAPSSTEPTAFEKQLISKGYKPVMYGTQKMYCRTEEVIGSRLGGHKVCGTADQLALDMHNAKELTEQAQKMPVNGGH